MNTTTIFSEGWIDIIFTGRNKAYGAYELRRITDRTLIFAALFSSAILAGAAVFSLLNGFEPQSPVESGITLTGDTLQQPPVIEVTLQPKPKPIQIQMRVVQDNHNYAIVDTLTENIPPDTMQPTVTMGDDTSGTGEATASIGGGNQDGGEGTDNTITVKKQNTDAESWAQIMPAFPNGGYPAMVLFISKHIRYPDFLRENGIEGTVHVGFIVETDGSITDVKVARGAHPMLDKEAMRVVKLMPKWTPGIQNGNKVRVRFVVPINFSLE